MIHQNRNSEFVKLVLPDTTKKDVTENFTFLSAIELPEYLIRYSNIPLTSHCLYRTKKNKENSKVYRLYP